MIERTLSLIKPDAVQRNLTGEILAMIQGAGLKVVALQDDPHDQGTRRKGFTPYTGNVLFLTA